MKTIGLVPMSAKPFHLGHFRLIETAASECDEVIVFVGLADRARKGEMPVLGTDMHVIWKNQIEKVLPSNVEVVYSRRSPLTGVYDRLSQLDRTRDDVDVMLYAGADDAARFQEKYLASAVPTLYASGRVRPRLLARTDPSSINVSGTAMRRFVSTGDFESFAKYMPAGVDPKFVWQRLRASAELREAFLRLIEDDAGGNPAWGGGGDLTPGMIGPYGIEFGDAEQLISTFVSPFVDVFKTAVAGAKEVSLKAQTLVWNSLQTVLTTLIPIYGYHYGEVFEKEKERIGELRSQYSDVFTRVDTAFASNDAAALAFMMAPGFVITRSYGRMGGKVVKGLLSVLTGGRSDKVYDAFKEKADSLGRWISATATGETRERRYEGRLYEAGDVMPEKILRSRKFVDASLDSSRARELSKVARKIHASTLTDVQRSAKEVLGAKDLTQLLKATGKGVKPDVAKKVAEIQKLPLEERQKATRLLLDGVRKGVKDFYVKSLTDHVESVKSAGIPEESPYVKDYRKVISAIKSM